jgi:hypothetical protein
MQRLLQMSWRRGPAGTARHSQCGWRWRLAPSPEFCLSASISAESGYIAGFNKKHCRQVYTGGHVAPRVVARCRLLLQRHMLARRSLTIWSPRTSHHSIAHKLFSACILPVRPLSNPYASVMGRALMLGALLVSAFFATCNAQSGNGTREDPKVRRQPLPANQNQCASLRCERTLQPRSLLRFCTHVCDASKDLCEHGQP